VTLQAYHEIDRLKDQLKASRTELATSEERSRRCHLELEVLRERGAANRAAERLRTVRGGRSTSPPGTSGSSSRGEVRGRDLYRDAFKASSSRGVDVPSVGARRSASTPATASSRLGKQRDRWVDADLDITDNMSSHLESSSRYKDTYSNPSRNRPVTAMDDSDSDIPPRAYSARDFRGMVDASIASSSSPDLEAAEEDPRHPSLSSRSRSAAVSRSHKARQAEYDSEYGILGDTAIGEDRRLKRSESPPLVGSRQSHPASSRSPIREVSSSADTADVLTPNGARVQYDRLQKMYQRVTGGRR
jgi:hypothetical protein